MRGGLNKGSATKYITIGQLLSNTHPPATLVHTPPKVDLSSIQSTHTITYTKYHTRDTIKANNKTESAFEFSKQTPKKHKKQA